MPYRSWRIRGLASVGRFPLDDEVYDVVDQEFGPIAGQTDLQKNIRLLCREIINNIARHDTSAFRVEFIISTNTNGKTKIEITHDGNNTNYLAAASPAVFIVQLLARIGATHVHAVSGTEKKYTVFA